MKRKLFTILAITVLTFSIGSTYVMQTAYALPKVGSNGHGDRGN